MAVALTRIRVVELQPVIEPCHLDECKGCQSEIAVQANGGIQELEEGIYCKAELVGR